MKVITISVEKYWPYAWLKDDDDGTTLMGGSLADAYGWEYSGFWVSPGLEQAFADWLSDFGWRCDDPAPDWPSFHERGIELCRRLKAQIGDEAKVVYCMTSEDPASIRTERTEILADGTLKPVTVRQLAPPE